MGIGSTALYRHLGRGDGRVGVGGAGVQSDGGNIQRWRLGTVRIMSSSRWDLGRWERVGK